MRGRRAAPVQRVPPQHPATRAHRLRDGRELPRRFRARLHGARLHRERRGEDVPPGVMPVCPADQGRQNAEAYGHEARARRRRLQAVRKVPTLMT